MSIFPKNMVWDKELNPEQMKMLEDATQDFINLRKKPAKPFHFQKNDKGEIVLPEGMLLHGTRFDEEKLQGISQKGILACEYVGMKEEAETYYCADFYRVPKTQTMQEYSEFVKTPKETVFPNGGMIRQPKIEKSRLPHYQQNETMAFIIDDTNPEIQSLLKNDVYRENENFEQMKDIVNWKAVGSNELFGHKDRLSAVLCGIPSNFISGIWVTEKLQNDPEKMKFLQQHFGHCSIINSKGEILAEPKNEQNQVVVQEDIRQC